MSTWYAELEFTEMDVYTADALLGLSEILEELETISEEEKEGLKRLLSRLEQATTPLYNNYPCKVYFVLLRERLEDYVKGDKKALGKVRELLGFLKERWPHNCP
ncbi:MAG: hypothetical protein ABWW69_04950 [Pyrodictiaceae archaeon]